MRILLVEDSARLQRSLTDGLRREGFSLDCTGNGEEALWYAESQPYDVIILDIMLPGIDGLEVLRRLRAAGSQAHVLLLTARSSVEDRVRGLELGADDYLIKPFAFEELVARLRALGRRAYKRKSPLLRAGPLLVNTSTRTVERSGLPVPLKPKEYALLEYLVLNSGTVVSRTQIEAHIYDDRVDPMSNVVDVLICNLRRKVDPPDGPSLIQTRRGMGYMIEEDGS